MKNIAKKRIKRGMTQKDLAEAIGVTIRTINNWEHEKTKPHGVFLSMLKVELNGKV